MIRLEIQLSTLSLVSLAAFLIPIVPAVLALNLGLWSYAPSSSLKVTATLTAVFLLLSSLSFLVTAFFLVPKKSSLIVTNGLPLVGVVVTGSVWFSSRLAQGPLLSSPQSKMELTCMILWILSIVTSAMASTYFIIQYTFLDNQVTIPVVNKLATVSNKQPGGEFHTPQRNELKTDRISAALTLQSETMGSNNDFMACYESFEKRNLKKMKESLLASPTTFDSDFKKDTPKNTSIDSVQHDHRLASLQPIFRLQHISDRSLHTIPPEHKHISNSLLQLSTSECSSFSSQLESQDFIKPHLEQLIPFETENSDSPPPNWSNRPSLIHPNEPQILPKQRKSSKRDFEGIVTQGINSISNSTRKLNTQGQQIDSDESIKGSIGKIQKNIDCEKGKSSSIKLETQAPNIIFDDWEVNSINLKQKLLISSMTNLELGEASEAVATATDNSIIRSCSPGNYAPLKNNEGSDQLTFPSSALLDNFINSGLNSNFILNGIDFTSETLPLKFRDSRFIESSTPSPDKFDKNTDHWNISDEEYDELEHVLKNHAYLGPMFQFPQKQDVTELKSSSSVQNLNGKVDISSQLSRDSSLSGFSFQDNDETVILAKGQITVASKGS